MGLVGSESQLCLHVDVHKEIIFGLFKTNIVVYPFASQWLNVHVHMHPLIKEPYLGVGQQGQLISLLNSSNNYDDMYIQQNFVFVWMYLPFISVYCKHLN